jgi:dTMP kinase
MSIRENGKRFFNTSMPNMQPSSLSGRLIVVEGADGSGRSTQTALLRDWLEESGYATVEVGLKRSELAGRELAEAMKGHTLSPLTFSLFYATDFVDQLEHEVIPALRSDFIVLADRYIYTLMARDIVRGANPEWIRNMYGIAIVPDIVFYLRVSPQVLAERALRKTSMLDYWESGMDIRRGDDWYEAFIRYQRQIQKTFHDMHQQYHFQVVDGTRSPLQIAADIRRRVSLLLEGGKPRKTSKGARPKRKSPR